MRLLFHCIVLLGLWLLMSCSQNDKNTFQVTTGNTMGTTYMVNYDARSLSREQIIAINKAIQKVVDDVNNKMSTYLSDSELSQFNLNNKINHRFYISDETAKVIAESIRLHQLTKGALDITVGPLVNLWGFGPENRKNLQPTKTEVEARKSMTGMHLFSLTQDTDARYYLSKLKPGIYLDLSAIAKGFAVDQVAAYLDTQKIKNYLVEIGGEIKSKGFKSKHTPWQIAIEKPNISGRREIAIVVDLKSKALATSGGYRNYQRIGNNMYNHEIDSRTGYPSESDILSMSVISSSSMTADGLATGLIIMHSTEALALANEQNIPVYIIARDKDGKIREYYSDTFLEFMKDRN